MLSSMPGLDGVGVYTSGYRVALSKSLSFVIGVVEYFIMYSEQGPPVVLSS